MAYLTYEEQKRLLPMFLSTVAFSQWKSIQEKRQSMKDTPEFAQDVLISQKVFPDRPDLLWYQNNERYPYMMV